MKNLQLLSINLLNSKYKLFLNFFIFILIYFSLFLDKSFVFCMTENTEEIYSKLEDLTQTLSKQQTLIEQQSYLLRNQSVLISALQEQQQKMEIRMPLLETQNDQMQEFITRSNQFQTLLYENQCNISNYLQNENSKFKNEIAGIKLDLQQLNSRQNFLEEALVRTQTRRTQPFFVQSEAKNFQTPPGSSIF